MKIFVDSANLPEIEQALERGFVSGVTTNPTILAKEAKGDFRGRVQEIIDLLKRYDADIPISVEVFTTDPKEMLKQADEFIRNFGGYEKLVIKVPIGWDELAVIRELRKRDIPVNCTCCMSYNQVIMAAAAGANYASLFYGRIRDIGHDGLSIVRQIHATFRERQPACELIVGSIRHITDINDVLQAGADIVTVPPKLFPQMVIHPKTDEVVDQFVTDFQKWMK